MRVAITFPGCHRRGGVERIMLECANFLASRGHETHVFASEWEVEALDSHVLRHEVPLQQRASLFRLTSFGKVSTNEMDRLGMPFDARAGFGVLSPPQSVVWVQSVHRAWLEISQRERSLPGRMKQWANLAHPVILKMEQDFFGGRKYKKVIALSEQVKSDLMRFYHVPENDIVIIPNGFAAGEFDWRHRDEKRSAMRRQFGFETHHKVLIFVANELERKGFRPLLRAVAALQDQNLRILAVGRLNPQSCADEVTSLGLSAQVQFVPQTNRVADYYAAADVFVLPTQYEAWGLVIVEAMACGLPVLTSRLAGAAIAVREGETGYLLDNPRNEMEIRQKLQVLLKGNHSAPHYIAESVANFAWSQVLPLYEQVLLDNRLT